MGLPIPTFPTPNEVQTEAQDRAQKIFADWNTLNAILQRYEELLRKRWAKKTREQRKKILLTAWPNMPAAHRPDLQVLQNESRQQAARGQPTVTLERKGCFMWPQINLDGLTKGKALMLLLNSRGRQLPDKFAYSDIDNVHIGYVSRRIVPPFLNEYTMLLSGQSTPETYGRLYAWENNDKAFDWMITGVGLIPGYGLNAMEIQQRILHFLVECCKLILHDVSASGLIDPCVRTQPEPGPIASESNEYLSLAALAAEAPYRVPFWVDFKRLEALVSAKVSETEDNIWLLREDPSYFAETVMEWKEHRQEILPDINGKPHPALAKPLFWNRVLGNVVAEAYGGLMIWKVVHRHILELMRLRDKYHDSISPEKPLPKEYQWCLRRFKHLLEQMEKGPLMNLKTGVPASPPLRSYWIRQPQDPSSTKIQVQTRGKIDYLLFTFTQLFDDEQRFFCGLQTLVEDFERQFQHDLKQKARLSPWVMDQFSQLAFISELQRQLRLYQPRLFEPFVSSSLDTGDEEATEQAIKWGFEKDMSPFANLLNNTKDMKLADFIEFPERNFYYPADKRRTKANTDAMRTAEEHLDNFWSIVDSDYLARTGRTLHDSFPSGLLIERPLQRTSEWIEPKSTRKDKVHAVVDDPPSALFSRLDLEQRTQRTISQSEPGRPNAKVKTRGQGHNVEPARQPEATQSIADKQRTFNLNKRAFKVFSTLFHQPSQHEQPGEVSWPDFLYAMVSTGFIPEKLYGSVWQFTPTKLDVERSINFHEPHPHGKIPFRTVRRLGRRLNRAYGWTAANFALA